MLMGSVRRVVPFLLALLAAVPQAAFAGQWYRCRYTGETRGTCCCPKQALQECEAAPAQVTRADCCDVFRRDPSVVSARSESRSELRVTVAQVEVALAPVHVAHLATGLTQAPAQRATAPPVRVEPLYIQHSSFLL